MQVEAQQADLAFLRYFLCVDQVLAHLLSRNLNQAFGPRQRLLKFLNHVYVCLQVALVAFRQIVDLSTE